MIVRMKIGFAAFALACASAHAMTLDELVAKNLDAHGGLARIQAITTLKSEGKLLFGGQFELALTQYQKAPAASRSEASLQGLTAVQAWDGAQAWQISPFQGRKDPEKMSADEARALANDAPIGGPLVDWQARGNRPTDYQLARIDTLAQQLGDVEQEFVAFEKGDLARANAAMARAGHESIGLPVKG